MDPFDLDTWPPKAVKIAAAVMGGLGLLMMLSLLAVPHIGPVPVLAIFGALTAVVTIADIAWVARALRRRRARRRLERAGAPSLPAPAPSGRCLRCEAPLGDARGSYDARACPSGHGALVSPPASERLLEALPAVDLDEARAAGSRRTRRRRREPACPACAGAMRAVRLRGAGARDVDVELCGACGAIWLDAGELDALLPGSS